MKYYMIAGERSGDMHGSNLIKALKNEDPEGEFRAWGGNFMKRAGADMVEHYDQLAVMGYTDAIKNINKFKNYITRCVSDLEKYQPDVLILIDFAGFNLRIAKIARSKNIKVFYYISPKIWAWLQGRAVKIKKYVDRMFVILPFEVDFYKSFDVAVKYVGNPVVDSVHSFEQNPQFHEAYGLDPKKKLVALLPGSRKSEIRYNLPFLVRLAGQYPGMEFAVSVVDNIPRETYNKIIGNNSLKLIEEDTYNLLFNADYAVVCSGTATLETALFEVPQLVVYRTTLLNYLLGKLLLKINYISLVNLILNEGLVKELIQYDLTDASLRENFEQLVHDASTQVEILQGYRKLSNILGSENASRKAARFMLQELKKAN